jgi:hypothetical protein
MQPRLLQARLPINIQAHLLLQHHRLRKVRKGIAILQSHILINVNRRAVVCFEVRHSDI